MNAVFSVFACSLLVLFPSILTAVAQDKDWRPVTQEEIQLQAPKVEPDADAEVLFMEVRILDNYNRGTGFTTTLDHYVRIKVFTEKGRDANNKADIRFGKIDNLGTDVAIKDLAARTIKPNGSIIEVKPSEIFERDLVKGSGIKYKAKSFIFPGVEAGAIVEWRWRELRRNSLSNYVRLEFAREIPVQVVKYYVKPVQIPRLGMRLDSINTEAGFIQEKDGFYSTTIRNVPSFRDEPLMPSEYRIKPWVLMFYDTDRSKTSAETYWRERGRKTYEIHKNWLEISDEVKRMTENLTGNSIDEEDQVRKIYNFCRSSIANIDDDAANISDEKRKNLKPNKSASDVLRTKMGNWHDIQMLFAAMLNALNFDVRIANISLRTDPHFDKRIANDFFNRTEIVTVKINNEWRFFTPNAKYNEFGIIPWNVEGQIALISDSNEPFFVSSPSSPPERTQQIRWANLKLTDGGSIEGNAKIAFTGHLGARYKEMYDAVAPSEREQALKENLKRWFPDTAELSAVTVENATDINKPFTCDFHVKIPSYVQKTGKRYFLVPNIFEKTSAPKFAASSRRFDISFDFAWEESDELTIEVPANFKPEALSSPPVYNNGRNAQKININWSDDRGVLTYKRTMLFGQERLNFYRSSYSEIKQLFDNFHAANSFVIVLTNPQ